MFIMTDDTLLKLVLSVLRERFGIAIQDGKIFYLSGGEAFITITAVNPTESMNAIARAVEAEQEEFDRRVHIQILAK